MDISQRLKTVADFVKFRTVADIGTDHAYVPCYLAVNKRIDKAFACDVNEGPLKKAAESIDIYGVADIVETRLGSGLVPLNEGEAETIIIAGMGGILMSDILNADRQKLNGVKQLILQPQRDAEDVRKLIHDLGFAIENEKMVFENGKYYNIISTVKENEVYDSETDYFFGRKLIENKDAVLKEYIEKRLGKYKAVLSNAEERPENAESLLRIKAFCLMAEEVLKKYEVQ